MKPEQYPRGDDPLPAELNTYYTEFFLQEDERTAGLDVYEDIFFSPLLFPLQRKKELAVMMHTARNIKPRVVFEIGADKGGGLYHWCKSLPTVERVIACEIRGTPYASLFEEAFPQIDFLWLPASSYDPAIVQRVAEWLRDDKIDCLFIDGDKCNFDTDFRAYHPLMGCPGIVFMHDIQDEAPRAGFDSVISSGFKHGIYIETSESTEATARESRGVPCTGPYEQWLRHWHGRSAGVGIIYLEKP